MAEPYRSQLDGHATPLSGASPESFGAAVGRGLEQAGAQISDAVHTIKARNRDQEAAAAGVEMAQISTELDKASIDARTEAGPGGEGHEQKITKLVDDRSQAAIDRIKDPHIRAAFTQRYAELKDHIVGREYGWEAGARVDHLAQNFEDMGTTLSNGQQANPDAVGLDVSLKTIETTGRALHLSADQQDKLIKQEQRKVAVGWANSMQDKDPHVLVAALDKGLLNHFLDDKDVSTLRSGGLAEIRRLDAVDRQRKSQAETQARETISTLLNKVGDGYVPSDQEWSQAHGLAKTFALEGREWDLGVAQDKGNVNRETRDWTPTHWHTEINALEAKGDKRTQAENVRLEHLSAAAGGSIARFNADPYAAAAAAGTPAPPVDWSNPTPNQIEAHVTWAKSFARSAGLVNVPLLPPDIVKGFQDRAKEPAGQLEEAATLRQWFGVANATVAAKQIDPNNKDLQLMVGLHPRMAVLYSRGIAAQKVNPKLLGVDADDGEALRNVFAEFSPAIPVDLQPAVLNAARAMTAGRAFETGHAELTGDELTSAFRTYVHRAAGMLGSANEGSATGGFVNWRGTYAWLPQTMSRNDFATRLSRADGPAWERAAGGAPYYQGADGKLAKMNDKQLAHLKEYKLETVNPGLYRLVSPNDGSHVVDAQGRPWQVDIRKLGPSFDEQLAAHGYSRR